MTTPILTVPRASLGRDCATNFFGTVWAIEDDWAQRMYRQLALVGFDIAAREGQAKLDERAAEHAEGEAKPAKPYAQVGNVAIIGIDGPLTKHRTSLSGFMGGTATTDVRRAMREAAMDDSVKSILMRVSSPGGEVRGIGDLADDIRKIRDVKPIVAYAEDVMASAALWLGVQASHVVASEHARVGSLGVYTQIMDDSVANEKAGVRIHTVKSTPKKAAGIPPVTDADLKIIQKSVDETHAAFAAAVAAGRGMGLEDAENVATGEVWSARKAKQLGLVDQVGSIDDAFALAQELAGEGASNLGAAVRRRRHADEIKNASLGTPMQAREHVNVTGEQAMESASNAASGVGTATSTEGSKQFDTLFRGTTPSPEQATANEPQPEEHHMAEPGAGSDPAAGAQSGTTPGSGALGAEVARELADLKAFKERVEAKEKADAELAQKSASENLKRARERVAAANPKMSAERIVQLVRSPEDADALIEEFRGLRGSTGIEVLDRAREVADEGLPNVTAEVQKRLAARHAARGA